MRRASIRSRLISRLTIVLLAVAVAADAGLFVYLRGELIEQYDDALATQAEAVAAVWRTAGDHRDAAQTIVRAFPKLRFGRGSGDYLWVRRGDGAVVLAVPAPPAGGPPSQGSPPPGAEHGVYDLILPNGRRGRAIRIDVGTPPTEAAATSPRFELILAETRREMDSTLAHFAIWLFSIGGVLSAAAVGMVVAVAKRELRPLQNFSEAVGRLDADSLTFRFPTHGLADELVPVAVRLNDLLQRLETAFGRERRFTANVSHELRTPLAELRSMVEVAMKWPPAPDELRRHHEQVLEVVQHMSALTQSLLTLVRSDDARLAASATDFDLVSLLNAVALPHERSAMRRGVGIDFEGPKAEPIRADFAILSSLFDNLFSNAAAYATSGTRISCRIIEGERPRTVTVRLANAADDLSVDDLDRLGEPFWRKDPARSPGDHAGLGLSLVRAYARAMNIDVRFRIEEPSRLVVDVIIPRP